MHMPSALPRSIKDSGPSAPEYRILAAERPAWVGVRGSLAFHSAAEAV